ncbi:sugar ABC transporter ATP-binding protein [Thermoflavimicrobium dichotomicum]|uniref:Ribose transport system ATP-binding protein n=1 Tax=Thermoflavimicrobium dichotomicum TaxID=46223 RepID=A0A1I3UYC1_9BACL|nr:sugar ABC transporter ATP-binding protein [Thermoflavimicrobium dichotomicum]SFJ88208.1 ribose transport system ATP-binding protein [Thermoflavimicrobium dichotomicum]
MQAVKETSLLKLSKVNKSFSGIRILKDIDLEIKAGEVHILLGENGAGKSTLIKIVTGAYRKDSGEIYWEGNRVAIESPLDAMNLGIATIYQELNLIPELTVYENIYLGREIKNSGKFSLLNQKEMKKRVAEYLKRLNLDISPEDKVSSLGIGKQQLVEIIRALMMDTRLIIMDEPTASLSASETETLLKIIDDLRKQGIAIIYISHRLDEIKQIGDRITILRDGCKMATLPVKKTSTEQMIQLMVGRQLKDQYPKESFTIGAEGLKVEDLRLRKRKETISFTAYQGQILGIAGLVGAGRTELARAIFGAEPIESGKVYVFGEEVTIRSPQDAIQAGLALISEDRKGEGLILDLDLEFNMTLTSLKRLKQGAFLRFKKLNEEANRYLHELRIRPSDVDVPARKLSGGNQQKVVIAKWLATNAKVFIFDEPTRGIDVGAKVEVYRLMNDLVKQGKVVIMISSDLPELLGMCDRILVMHEGKMTADLSREEADQEIIMKAATGGIQNA